MELTYNNKKTEEEIILNIKSNFEKIDNNVKNGNILFHGDNLKLLANLAFNSDFSSFKDKIKCIYIDPPFAKKMTFRNKHGEFAYEDQFEGQEFIETLRERLILSKYIINEGFIFLHTDHTIGHYIKVIMDEIFGAKNFFNEIISSRVKKNDSNSNRLNVDYDHIYVYKIGNPKTNSLFTENKNKKPYWHSLDAKGQGGAKEFFGKMIEPPAGTHWRWSQERINTAIKNKELKLNTKGKPVYLVKPKPIKLGNNWTDICCYSFKTGYPTEKSFDFLSRIIQLSTKENDYVIDFYGGSGATAYTASKLGRNWITGDMGELSIKTMKQRLTDFNFIK